MGRRGGTRDHGVVAKIPLHPKNPERICWGCDKYCPADAMACGNGTIRTPHPQELFGEDWAEWEAAHSGLMEIATAIGSK